MKKIILLCLLPLLLAELTMAQKGPGGVGDQSGSSFLDLWFDASDLDGDGVAEGYSESGYTSALLVDAWHDRSGNGAVAVSPSTPIDLRLSYQFSGSNNYPCITNTGANKQLVTGIIERAEKETIFCVSTTLDTGDRTVYDAGPGNRHRMYSDAATAQQMTITGPVCNTSPTFTNQTLISKAYFSDTEKEELQINQNTPQLSPGLGVSATADGFLYLGCGTISTVPTYLNGNIMEFIAFDGRVNAAQNILIFNYLSAKYNIALFDLDLYTQDDAGKGNFDHDVAGIGRVDASNAHADAQGTGIVRINDADDLDDDEFLIWGHDTGSQSFINYDVPVGVAARFERLWRVSEVDAAGSAVEVGATTVSFDLTGLGPILATDLRLLVDTDDDGQFYNNDAIAGAVAMGSNIYKFTGVETISNNLRFTLASTNQGLPINLVYFEAQAVDQAVHLAWETATEINNDHFTVERSPNALDWSTVTTVEGASHSSENLSYAAIDDHPHQGRSYYRLSHTNTAGQTASSEIRIVEIDAATTKVAVYPNPTAGHLTVTADADALSDLKFYNALGQLVQPKVIMTDAGQTQVDISNLPAGTYFLQAKNTAITVYKH